MRGDTTMILYTADLYFGHANVVWFDHRPFNDVDPLYLMMEYYEITRWYY